MRSIRNIDLRTMMKRLKCTNFKRNYFLFADHFTKLVKMIISDSKITEVWQRTHQNYHDHQERPCPPCCTTRSSRSVERVHFPSRSTRATTRTVKSPWPSLWGTSTYTKLRLQPAFLWCPSATSGHRIISSIIFSRCSCICKLHMCCRNDGRRYKVYILWSKHVKVIHI